ncbi:MAG: hypothetical protein HY286_15405 [Planctomycetes bacterium]|nr:hypothetical protein [Planctomycetota bacterium]
MDGSRPPDEPAPRGAGKSGVRGWELSNTHPPNTKIVASGIDTLYLGFRASLLEPVLTALEAKRQLLLSQSEAARAAWDGSVEGEFKIGKTIFTIRPHAAHGYKYRLSNADATLLINPKAPGSAPTVIAQLRSAFLWREGWKRAAQLTCALAREMLGDVAEVNNPIVSRVDICVDFQGWIPEINDLGRFVTRANYRATHLSGTSLSGFSFGRGLVTARIYDKTLEIVNSQKGWFRAVWEKEQYNPALPVWRLEYQLRREWLRELGINNITLLEKKLGQLWQYLLLKWLRLAIPDDQPRRERWPTDPAWLALRDAGFITSGGELMRARSRALDEERIIRTFQGCITSFGAHQGVSSLNLTVRMLRERLESRLRCAGTTFETLVRQKRRMHAGTMVPVN